MESMGSGIQYSEHHIEIGVTWICLCFYRCEPTINLLICCANELLVIILVCQQIINIYFVSACAGQFPSLFYFYFFSK